MATCGRLGDKWQTAWQVTNRATSDKPGGKWQKGVTGDKRHVPTTVGSRSTKTARGTCLPAPVSLKKVLKESSPPPMVLSEGIWPSGWMPCSRQYSSQQALPIWTPACPTWMEIHSRCTQRRHTGHCPAGPTHEALQHVLSNTWGRGDTSVSTRDRGDTISTWSGTTSCEAGAIHQHTGRGQYVSKHVPGVTGLITAIEAWLPDGTLTSCACDQPDYSDKSQTAHSRRVPVTSLTTATEARRHTHVVCLWPAWLQRQKPDGTLTSCACDQPDYSDRSQTAHSRRVPVTSLTTATEARRHTHVVCLWPAWLQRQKPDRAAGAPLCSARQAGMNECSGVWVIVKHVSRAASRRLIQKDVAAMARRTPVSLALQPRAPWSLALLRLFTGSIDWAAAMATTYLPARLTRQWGRWGWGHVTTTPTRAHSINTLSASDFAR